MKVVDQRKLTGIRQIKFQKYEVSLRGYDHIFFHETTRATEGIWDNNEDKTPLRPLNKDRDI